VEHIFNIPRILELADTVWTLKGGRVFIQKPNDVASSLSSNHRGFENLIHMLARDERRVSQRSLQGGASLTTISRRSHINSEPVLEVEDLVVKRGKRLVIGERTVDNQIQGFSLTLNRGEIAFLQAPNGWGKTTLLEAINGVIPCIRGSVRLQGAVVDSYPVWRRAQLGISFLQARNNTFPALTVRESLRLAGIREIPSHLGELLDRRASDLSGGEKQKVAISVAQVTQSSCLMMDEPFSALDADSITAIKDGFFNNPNRGVLVALPSHSSCKTT
jgi:lipopolysaccharide export system ATP-binding protein